MEEENVPPLDAENYTQILFTTVSWIVDDTNVYRVTIHKTFEGNLITKPINGALLVINPSNGQLFLKTIHYLGWDQTKRLGQLQKWKSAEETAALIRALPEDIQPKQIIARNSLLEPLSVHLLDFANIIRRGCSVPFYFGQLLKIERFRDHVLRATESQLTFYCLYDDWLETVSPFTAFSRLILLVRALGVNADATQELLASHNAATVHDHIWPSLTVEQWITTEIQLKKMIIEDYCSKMGLNESSLTLSDIRNIVLQGISAEINKE